MLFRSRDWKIWYKTVKMLAKATGTGDVLDPNYVPGNTTREQNNWDHRQGIMFVALFKKIQIPIGKTIVAKHMDKSDSQAVLKDLVDHFSATGLGTIEMTHAEEKLHEQVFMVDAAHYLKDKQSGGTLTGVIETWCRNLLDLEEMTGNTTDPDEKKRAFQKFIRPIKELRHVTDQEKSTSALLGSASATVYTPDIVIELYKQAAYRIDIERRDAILKQRGTISRAVNVFNSLYAARNVNVTICQIGRAHV